MRAHLTTERIEISENGSTIINHCVRIIDLEEAMTTPLDPGAASRQAQETRDLPVEYGATVGERRLRVMEIGLAAIRDML
jgi:hypothetical protein